MQNNSYITVLSTENYLEGVLVLAESLKKTNARYPLTVVITEDISEEIINLLNSYNIKTIRKSKVLVPECIKQKNEKGAFSHWTNTFDKLLIFELTEFDKLVYLDSDMYVRNNIDELFERDNMSATIDRRTGPFISEEWMKLTSGLLVIEPRKGIRKEFEKIILEIVNKRESIGDQDILQEYDTEWGEKKQLHLDVKYNMFFPHIDYFTHYGGYNLKNIDVVHFIYTKKPFCLKENELHEYIKYIETMKQNNYKKNKTEEIRRYIECGNEDEKAVLKEYFEILENVRTKLGKK